MADSRRARPRYPLDDSWLFTDPMSIVLDCGDGEPASVEEAFVAAESGGNRINAEPPDPAADRGVSRGGRVGGTLGGKKAYSPGWCKIPIGVALAIGFVCGLSVSGSGTGLETAQNEPVVARQSCEAPAMGTRLLRTL